MRKGFEDRMKRHCNEMKTVKPHKKLVEEDDKDFQDQLTKQKSCNPMRILYETGLLLVIRLSKNTGQERI